eukprot:COSAG06_NODE_37920_length_429_cov_1.236364_1_plen_96_part_10
MSVSLQERRALLASRREAQVRAATVVAAHWRGRVRRRLWLRRLAIRDQKRLLEAQRYNAATAIQAARRGYATRRRRQQQQRRPQASGPATLLSSLA